MHRPYTRQKKLVPVSLDRKSAEILDRRGCPFLSQPLVEPVPSKDVNDLHVQQFRCMNVVTLDERLGRFP